MELEPDPYLLHIVSISDDKCTAVIVVRIGYIKAELPV